MGLFSFFKRKKAAEPTPEVKPIAENTVKPDEATVNNADEIKAQKEEKAPTENAPKKATKSEKSEALKKAANAPETKSEKAQEPKKTEKTAMKEEQKDEPAPEAMAEEKSNTQPTAEKITGRFEIKKAKDGRYVFNLYASNHVIVATSQVYSSSQGALTGINSVIANADKAPTEDRTLKSFETYGFPKWEIYLDKGQQYRFRLYAANGSCICHSQGYTSKASCKNGIDSIIRSSRNAEIDKSYLKKEDK